jgi:diguanylate cyclase (GGDEF)-like protein/PAS domain S-box-containing protein
MKRYQYFVSASLVVVGVGVLAALWRFWLEEFLDPLLFGSVHGTNKQLEDMEFIGVSLLFVSLAMIPAGLFAAQAIRRQEEAEGRLRLSDSIIANANEGILVTDGKNRIIAVNPAFTVISGYGSGEVLGRTPRILSSGRHDTPFYQSMWREICSEGRWAGEIWNQRSNGEEYVQWLSISTLQDPDGAVQNYVGFFSDITERKKREEKISWQASHDGLTGLRNRKDFLDTLGREILMARVQSARLAVWFLDLDGFKPVNDTYGHEMGDLVLQWAAKTLQDASRRDDVVARFGGDEFVILSRVAEIKDVERVADKLLLLFSAPQLLAGHEIRIGVSVGVAVFPEDGQESTALLRCADVGMYAAKQAGKNTWRRGVG